VICNQKSEAAYRVPITDYGPLITAPGRGSFAEKEKRRRRGTAQGSEISNQ